MFVSLPPSDMPPAGRAGCLLSLAAVLLVLGGGIVAVYVGHPAGKGDMWVAPVVGSGFALIGALLLYAGVRGARGLKVPAPEVFIEDGVRLTPGTAARVRLRQPGPMEVESLKLRVCCERLYRRRVRPNSTATVEDRELLWEQVLDEVTNERIPAGAMLEREVVLRLPADARPSGPATPEGTIRWQIEVWGEAGFMRATYRDFAIEVEPFGGGAPAAPDEAGRWRSARAAAEKVGEAEQAPPGSAEPRGRFGLSARSGLLIVGLGFIIPAVFFLWAFFSGAAFAGRGNPYMALVGGIVFGGVGLLALALGVMSYLPAPKADPNQRRGRSDA